jgi:chromosome segregation ATPase
LPLRDELESLEVHTLAEVEAAYDDAENRANSIHDNPEALRKYERQKREIEQLSQQLEQAMSNKSAELDSIKNRRRGWEATLDNTVAKINLRFSKYMADMDCAGEVFLRKGEEGEGEYDGLGNFADWGIEIRVSFRAGSKLQVLDSGKHSGGERSVSTIMYLMAMQDLMLTPFRCVDEINQGLDDRNERLVFKRIVLNSTKPPHAGDPTAHAGQ